MEKTNSTKRGALGLVVLTIGTLLLLRSLGIYEDFINEYIFRWEMILIGFGVVNLLSHEGPGPGFLFILIGGGLYARNYLDLPVGISFWQLFLAGVFILMGLFLIFKRKKGIHCEKVREDRIGIDTIDEVAFFGGGDRTVVTDNFKGGKMLAIFGGSNFNLSRSKLAPGKNYIDVFAVFGGFKLIVPDDWNIKVSTVAIFGGFSDKHRMQSNKEIITEEEPQLIIKGLVIFGGGEIKSY